jgi:hypothetical protein
MPDDVAGAALLTREEFDRRRAALKRVARREGRVLDVFSVGLGLAQLLLWCQRHSVERIRETLDDGVDAGAPATGTRRTSGRRTGGGAGR